MLSMLETGCRMRKKHIAELEGELELAYEAMKERKREPLIEKRIAVKDDEELDEKPLPTAAWSDEHLEEFIERNQLEIGQAQEAITHAESKAEASKEKLLRLISNNEEKRCALRESNILQLVVMDDIRESRHQVEKEHRRRENFCDNLNHKRSLFF